jgi:putative transposase
MATRSQNNSDARMTRGLSIYENSEIVENEDGSFRVPSQTSGALSYEVRLIGRAWVCTCPDFETRADVIDCCKHGFAVRFWIAARVELEQKPKPKVFADDALQCGKCGSIKVVRFGHENGKQVFKCKECGKKFREGLLRNAQYSPETITLTLDLYFSGLSLRKITRTLNDHFDVSLGKSSVYRWIQAYVPMISEYVNSLSPQLSETWHADELFVKMKGGTSFKTKTGTQVNLAFLWNVMDRKTRFLIASKLSKYRDAVGAENAFKEAMKNAHDSQPEKVLTDGLNGYRDGIAFAFKGQRPEHVARVGIRKPHANNNRIERLNGTLRERVKVQRGWKTMKTPLAEGARIQYNFVKPHMALEGQTPAQAAGIGAKGKDKWLGMLTEAFAAQSEGQTAV